MDSDDYFALLVFTVLAVLPIIAACLLWLLIDPATVWQKMGAILVCGVGATLVFIGEMALAVIFS